MQIKLIEEYICKTLCLSFEGQNYPLRVKEIHLSDGSAGYSLEIDIDHTDTVVIDSINLAQGLREAESLLPVASEARRIAG